MRPYQLAAVTFLSLSTLALACGDHPPPPRNGGQGGDGGDGGNAGDGGRGGRDAGVDGKAGRGEVGRDDVGGAGGVVGAGGGDGGAGEATAGCTTTMPDSLCCKPLGKMPKTIKETGIFPTAPELSMAAACLRAFTPDMPLWSDGMEKQRFVLLPPGKQIDNSKPKAWVFPVGTVFIKTFFDDTGPGGKPRPIETRFIRRAREGMFEFDFEYYLYRWNAQGTDAELVLDDMASDPQAAPTVMVTIKRTQDGKPFTINNGMPFAHTLPSREMCTDCHQENALHRQTFIGFDSARLNMKRSAMSAKTQLAELDEAKLFMKPLAPPEEIKDPGTDMGVQLRVKRWIFGNCVHCHNGDKVFDLHPDLLLKNTVNVDEDAQMVEAPMGWKRVVPGSPQTSILFVQVQRTMLPPMTNGIRLRAMPPVGVADVAADQAAIADLRAWILALPKM